MSLKVTPLDGFGAYRHTAAATTLLLDTYTGAAFAYSLRKLRTAYAGSAVRIRESGGNTEADIGFSGNDFDAAAAAAHIGGNSGFITKWYDQSGNGVDISQSSSSAQPAYSATGLNSLPTVQFDGSNDQLELGSGAQSKSVFQTGTELNYTMFAVLNQDGSEAQNGLLIYDENSFNGGGQNKMAFFTTYDDTIYSQTGQANGSHDTNVAQPTGWDNNDHIVEFFRDSSDNQGITVDGTNLVTATRTSDLVADGTGGGAGFYVGSYYGAIIRYKGNLSEMVFWGTDLGSSNRTGARTNLNSYYAVF